MSRTKRTPLKVIDYDSLSDEMKAVYDSIRTSFERKNIFKLREEAKLLAIESPTTLSKDALVKRMTDRVVGQYTPARKEFTEDLEITTAYGEEMVTGIVEDDGTGAHIGQYDVQPALVREADLREGDLVCGTIADLGGKKTVIMVNSVEGEKPGTTRPLFGKIIPCERTSFGVLSGIAASFFSDLKHGERVMVPRMTMNEAAGLLRSFKYGLGLYVGLSPEEQRRVSGGNFAIGFDYPQKEETRIARVALERAKRLSERGNDVVLVVYGFGDLRDRDLRRAIFGSGRCFERGSLTVIIDADKDEEGGVYQRIATRVTEKD